MRRFHHWLVGCPLVAASLLGCGNCEQTAEDVRAFLEDPANLTCQTDNDCVVVSTQCSGIGFCGQATLSRTASTSKGWRDLSDELEACNDDCSVCTALLLPHCGEGGLCGRAGAD